jgi:hypothetical protein
VLVRATQAGWGCHIIRLLLVAAPRARLSLRICLPLPSSLGVHALFKRSHVQCQVSARRAWFARGRNGRERTASPLPHCVCGRYEDDQIFTEIQANVINAARLIDGSWYIVIKVRVKWLRSNAQATSGDGHNIEHNCTMYWGKDGS